MSIVIGESLRKYYGAQDIFEDLSFRIARGDKIALVGDNGVGKTTLLLVIAGLEPASSGQVTTAKSLRIGYLAQQADLESDHTLYQEMDAVFVDLHDQQALLRVCERQMADPEQRERAMLRYGELLQRYEMAGGYTYEHRIRSVLGGLGFSKEALDQPLSWLSGGQQTRARLAKLLLSDPDLLLLDEPTNHLDLQATQWLEEYLRQWKGAMVVVAHDRYFLDQVVTRVWELDSVGLDDYSGNYSEYAMQRVARRQRRAVEYEAQQEHIEKTEDFIRRYKAGQRSREARGRQTLLDRIERIEAPAARRTMRFRLSSQTRGGDNVLRITSLSVGYDKPLIRAEGVLLRRGERVALLGPNGCGKTTFLKTLLGELPPLAGQAKVGINVQVAYFAQGHENLRAEKTVLDEILSVKNLPLTEARGLLGRFLFSGDDVFKRIAQLSGGERGRVALAMLSLHGANFLLLDEPTNHLDIRSQELLEQVLEDFEGTVLFVSHDRYFIDALATQVWVVADGVLRVYEGNYSDYRQQVANGQASSAEESPPPKRRRVRNSPRPAGPADDRGQEARKQDLEGEIASLELSLSNLSRELETASGQRQVDRLYDLGRQYQEVQRQLQDRLEEWVQVAE